MKGDPAGSALCPICNYEIRVGIQKRAHSYQGKQHRGTRWPSTGSRLRKAVYNHAYNKHVELSPRELSILCDGIQTIDAQTL